MQRIGQNGGLCRGEQKTNSNHSRKNSLKMFCCCFGYNKHVSMPYNINYPDITSILY